MELKERSERDLEADIARRPLLLLASFGTPGSTIVATIFDTPTVHFEPSPPPPRHTTNPKMPANTSPLPLIPQFWAFNLNKMHLYSPANILISSISFNELAS